MHARACGHDRKAREVPLAVVILTVVDEVCISEDVGNQFDEIFSCQSKTSCVRCQFIDTIALRSVLHTNA